MRWSIFAGITMLTVPLSAAQPCRVIHGRAIYYNGDGVLAIWHIGTHHTFQIVDEKSSDLIFHYIPYMGGDETKNCLQISWFVQSSDSSKEPLNWRL